MADQNSYTFDVRYTNQAYNTQRIFKQSASSTSSPKEAARRLGAKLLGQEPGQVEEVKGVFDEHSLKTRWTVTK